LGECEKKSAPNVEFGNFATTKVIEKHESLRAFSVSSTSITKRGGEGETTFENRTAAPGHDAAEIRGVDRIHPGKRDPLDTG
jgi:hypothetical protein